MSRIYANENFPRRVVEALRILGHDVLTVKETGHANQGFSDPDVLAFAISEKRAVLTLNRKHFVRLHIKNPSHDGIIICTEDRDYAGQAQRIHEALHAIGNLRSQLIKVYRPNP